MAEPKFRLFRVVRGGTVFFAPIVLAGGIRLYFGRIGRFAGRAKYKKIRIITVLLFIYSVALWPFFVEGQTPVPLLSGLGITWEGVMVGAGMGLRLLIMLWVGIWLLSIMTIEELAQASQQLGLSSRAGFAFTWAFRWVGMLLGTGVGVVQAQRSRGLDLSAGGILQRVRQYSVGHSCYRTCSPADKSSCYGT